MEESTSVTTGAGAAAAEAGTAARGLSPRTITTAALIAALLAASVLITIPLGPVPFTFQVFVVVLAALLLTPGQAALAVGVYLLAGLAGLPVFSGLRGGLGVLAGPTGGYLIGFLVGATLAAFVRMRVEGAGEDRNAVRQMVSDVAAGLIVLAVVYVLGVIQLSIVAGMPLSGAIAAGALPFLPFDLLKIAGAVAIASAVRAALPRS